MSAWKTVYEPVCGYGSDYYRVTTNGKVCNLQRNRRTVARISFEEWEKYAEEYALYDRSRDDPAYIANLIIKVTYY